MFPYLHHLSPCKLLWFCLGFTYKWHGSVFSPVSDVFILTGYPGSLTFSWMSGCPSCLSWRNSVVYPHPPFFIPYTNREIYTVSMSCSLRAATMDVKWKYLTTLKFPLYSYPKPWVLGHVVTLPFISFERVLYDFPVTVPTHSPIISLQGSTLHPTLAFLLMTAISTNVRWSPLVARACILWRVW